LFTGVQKLLQISIFFLGDDCVCSLLFIWVGVNWYRLVLTLRRDLARVSLQRVADYESQ
jgi:hypothetical protein